MIYVVMFVVALVLAGAPLHRALKRILRRAAATAPAPADPALLAHLAAEHPMRERPRAVDAMWPWTTQGHDGPEFQALLAEVMAATRAPSGSL